MPDVQGAADRLLVVAKGRGAPNWVHLIGYVLVTITTSLGVWSQMKDAFPTWFTPPNVGMEEFRLHFNETPDNHFFMVDGVGPIKVSLFPSDRCLLIARPNRVPIWFRAETAPVNPPTRSPLGYSPISGGAVLAAEVSGSVTAAQRCLWPHPGRYVQREGRPEHIDGWTWVPVYTLYEDRCEHFQYLRADGYWDVNSDGSPRVTWVACYH